MTLIDSHRPEIASKHVVARDFGAASDSYDCAARLQRHMGERLLAQLPRTLSASKVLDLGCGTGQFVPALSERYPQARVTGVDLSAAMVAHARRQRAGDYQWLVADAERLPLASGSVDAVFSNLMIQWCTDPRPVLAECLRVLRPGGMLVCSTLVQGTLRELAAAWQQVDPGVDHVNRFEAWPALLEQVMAVAPQAAVEQETVTLPYESPMQLLAELKSLGAQYKGGARRKTVTAPGRLRRLAQQYPRRDGEVLASYEAAYITYRRPD
ncbi:MAG: malonyl-ACP O-methyltransferase BioC [Pseudomonadales bacterium]|nr:malonyl-ACP O-methyltransferase BioC [Pseudomonadales bacterium]